MLVEPTPERALIRRAKEAEETQKLMTPHGGSTVALPGSGIWQDMRPDLEGRPAVVLFALAHAGAGPSSLRALERLLPADWAVFALGLPGRERRMAEPPDWEFQGVAETAAEEARTLLATEPYHDTPVLMVGQCSGAWLAYAVLARAPELQPRCRALFVVSQAPWHAPRRIEALPEDSDAMWSRLSTSGDIPPDVAVDEEMREMLEPVFRADYRAVEGFPTLAEPLKCPIVAVGGSGDAESDDLCLAEWARYSSAHDVIWLDCGHLPVQEMPDEIARLMVVRNEPVVPEQSEATVR